jgi:hypothetical protein
MITKLTNLINNGILLKASFIILLIGFSTIPLSQLAHIHKVSIDQPYVIETQQHKVDVATLMEHYIDNKEVGYLSAINWWPNSTLFIPLLGALMALLISSINKTNTILVNSGMVVFSDLTKGSPSIEELKNSWLKNFKVGIIIWLCLSFVAFGYSYLEYYIESYQTLSLGIVNPTVTPDWTIGCLIDDILNCDVKANSMFNAYVFTIQGIIASFGLLLFCIAGSYGAFIFTHSHYEHEWFFIPNKSSPDLRKGFEAFEEIGMLLLTLGMVAYTIIYFIILQNLYLADGNSTSLFWGASPFLKYSIDFATSIITVDLSEISIVIALIFAFCIITMIVAVVPALILSLAALRSRKNYSHLNGNSELPNLEGMVIWPYKWVKVNVLIIVLSLSLFALLIPSLALHLGTLYLTGLVTWIGSVINKKYSKKI